MLDFIYCNIVSPMYSYLGMTTTHSAFYYVISWIMVFVYSLMLFKIINRPQNGAVIISILIICSAISTTTIVAYVGFSIGFAILNVFYWAFIVALYCLCTKKKKIGEHKFKRNSITLYAIFFFFAAIIVFICVVYTGFHISFNLYDVYETRQAFKGKDIPLLLAYLYSASIIVFPIIIVYGLNKKKPVLVVAAICFQLLAYSADGRKSTLFALVATLLGYYFIQSLTAKMIPVIITGLTFFGILEKWVLGTKYLIDFFIRRLFLLTGYLQYAYYDFFKDGPKDLMRQSIIGKLGFSSPYTQPIPLLIGNHYYVRGSHANNGLFSDAYSNFGIWGIIILPVFIVLALKLLDKTSEGLSSGICLGLIIVSSYTLLSSSFFTVMLTHGFLLGCIIIYVIPRFSSNVMRNQKEIIRKKM